MRYPGFEVCAFLKDWIWLVFSLEQWILTNGFCYHRFLQHKQDIDSLVFQLDKMISFYGIQIKKLEVD